MRRSSKSTLAILYPLSSILYPLSSILHPPSSPLRHPASRIDLQDVKYLIKAAKIDTSSKEFTDIAERYATDAIRRILREPGEESSP